MSADLEIRVLEANIVHSGDTVILNYPDQRISKEVAETIKARCAGLLPEDVKVMIVSAATVTIARGTTEGVTP